ncbi:hypothetical protein EJ04DRAFT_557779 [Polyplosphaeria fusca]|uniref:Uncharacterized protein n=1 Tax=Polyplosphaeria fusca TaxID=682080 RepID=A0A9P4QJR8_9PLEO|nr:hypothetical protein EJ04DRAFT_557779 [Polyplosphaeria fusca]
MRNKMNTNDRASVPPSRDSFYQDELDSSDSDYDYFPHSGSFGDPYLPRLVHPAPIELSSLQENSVLSDKEFPFFSRPSASLPHGVPIKTTRAELNDSVQPSNADSKGNVEEGINLERINRFYDSIRETRELDYNEYRLPPFIPLDPNKAPIAPSLGREKSNNGPATAWPSEKMVHLKDGQDAEAMQRLTQAMERLIQENRRLAAMAKRLYMLATLLCLLMMTWIVVHALILHGKNSEIEEMRRVAEWWGVMGEQEGLVVDAA